MLFLVTLGFMVIRTKFSIIETLPQTIGYLTVALFGLIYLFTGKVLAEQISAWILNLIIWIALIMLNITGSGLAMPIVVLFPLIPTQAIMFIINRSAVIVTWILSIVSLIFFIYLEAIDYNFTSSRLVGSSVDVMRGVWLIFIVTVISVIG